MVESRRPKGSYRWHSRHTGTRWASCCRQATRERLPSSPGCPSGGGRGFAGRRSRCAEWSGYGRNTTAGDLRTGGGFPGRPPRRCEGASRCTTSARDRGSRGGAQPPLCRAAVGGKDNDDRRLPGVLPPLTFGEAVETTTIHSVVGLVPQRLGMLESRPSRTPGFVPPTTPSQTWPRSEAGVSRVQANSA